MSSDFESILYKAENCIFNGGPRLPWPVIFMVLALPSEATLAFGKTKTLHWTPQAWRDALAVSVLMVAASATLHNFHNSALCSIHSVKSKIHYDWIVSGKCRLVDEAQVFCGIQESQSDRELFKT